MSPYKLVDMDLNGCYTASMTAKHHIYKETTVWADPCPNHVYVFTSKPVGKFVHCIGYVKQGTKVLIKFSSPLRFELKDRTFEELK